ncbi:MAG: hypothetical protein C5B55_01585 [Blastocatellia bacterium]|nr:MAG: hypothetical protein C5B55_01585 [Blastocatellia bacterium]
MRRLILRITVAALTFAFGVLITTTVNSLFNSEVTMPPQQFTVLESLQGPVGHDRDDYGDYAALWRLYDGYEDAQMRHDHAFFKRVEAENYVMFDSEGTRYTRDEDLRLLDSDPKTIKYKHSDLGFNIYGDAAVVTGRMTATDPDGSVESWKWVDVCLKRDGRWQIISTTQFDYDDRF